jgi:hypothetical protein
MLRSTHINSLAYAIDSQGCDFLAVSGARRVNRES